MNKMNFPDWKSEYFEGVRFDIPTWFESTNYWDDFTLSEKSRTFHLYELELNASIEVFTGAQVSVYQFSSEKEGVSELEALHAYYLNKRADSMNDSFISESQDLSKKMGYPCYLSMVEGNANYYDEKSNYLTATCQVNNRYYVLQFIGSGESMPYLYDDFLKILKSMH